MDYSKIIDRTMNVLYFGVTVLIAVTLFRSIKSSMNQMGKGGGGGDMFGFGKSVVK